MPICIPLDHIAQQAAVVVDIGAISGIPSQKSIMNT
jgi:hypothetical protein